ncbi:MAG: hypothetical protein WCM76_16615 [Bacteroidota bacterium]
MKKMFLLSAVLIILQLNGNAQTGAFTPGWYIIQSSAAYSVIMPGYSDLITDDNGIISEPDLANLPMAGGEIVLAFDFNKDKYFCFDPLGRMVVFSGAASLTKAPDAPGCGVGLMNETITLIGGEELGAGAYYWIIGQDIAKSTVTIMVQGGQKFEIPQAKITLLTAELRKYMKTEVYKPVN